MRSNERRGSKCKEGAAYCTADPDIIVIRRISLPPIPSRTDPRTLNMMLIHHLQDVLRPQIHIIEHDQRFHVVSHPSDPSIIPQRLNRLVPQVRQQLYPIPSVEVDLGRVGDDFDA